MTRSDKLSILLPKKTELLSIISKVHQALDKLKPDEKPDSELGIIINRYGKREDKSYYLVINR